VSPMTPEVLELRERLGAMGVEFSVTDEVTEYEDGYVSFSLRTELPGGASATVAWSRTPDDEKRFDSYGGAFGYLELRVGDDVSMATVDEVMEAVDGR